MPDISDHADDENLFDEDFSAALRVGAKVLEMCDRVMVAHKCCPGAQVRWIVEVDGQQYNVAVGVNDSPG